MLSYRINTFNIYLRLNKIIIVNDDIKSYEKIFITTDFYGCDTNKDVYIILKTLLENNNINIIQDNSNVILYIKPTDNYIYLLETNNNNLLQDVNNNNLLQDVNNNDDIDEIKLFCILIIVFTVLNFLTYILL